MFLCLTVCTSRPALARQQSGTVVITSPQAGEAVQGVVSITGSVIVQGFSYYELAFAFDEDSTETWFVFERSNQSVTNSTLGEWDTSALTDGGYSLRLSAYNQDGEATTTVVSGVRVRNYTAQETGTPTAPATASPGETALPTSSPTLLHPTATARPDNPASVQASQVRRAAIGGAIAAVLILAALGTYVKLRKR